MVIFLAASTACGSSQVRDRTLATVSLSRCSDKDGSLTCWTTRELLTWSFLYTDSQQPDSYNTLSNHGHFWQLWVAERWEEAVHFICIRFCIVWKFSFPWAKVNVILECNLKKKLLSHPSHCSFLNYKGGAESSGSLLNMAFLKTDEFIHKSCLR